MRPLYAAFACFLLIGAQLHAQPCDLPDTATADLYLQVSVNGNNNHSAVVWNPLAQLYYAVDAGSGAYNADTYDATGAHLDSVLQGFDYRGAWWNPGLQQLEGNGYSTLGIWVQDLDPVTHHPLSTGTVILAAAQPDAQSIGTLDPEANMIVYYYGGNLYRYDRATNTALGTLALTGIPGDAALNDNTVVYVGCPGHELGVYDYANRRLLFVDKQTGAYAGACQLPDDAPQRASFGVGYANGYFFLLNTNVAPYHWVGYGVGPGVLGVHEAAAPTVRCYPVPTGDVLQATVDATVQQALVLDVLGRVQRVPMQLTASPLRLDVGALPMGTYTLLLRTTRGEVRTPFVVAH